MVRRARLIERLKAITDDVNVLLITAGPGYGKSTLLGQWAAEDPRRFAIVHLEVSDRDPARLLRRIAAALHPIIALDDALWRSLSAGDASALALVPRLIKAMRAHAEPVVIVLDDVHLIDGTPAGEVVVALGTTMPTGSHLAVASRSHPQLKLTRLRSQGRCAEFGARELAFAGDEASALLAATGVDLEPNTVHALVRQTEGWPAGLYLSALALRGRPDIPAEATTILNGNVYILDYFRDEVFSRQSSETMRLLMHTAALDQLSGDLCDAVLDRTGSAAWLAEIERRNLFLIPQDGHRRWYRYHRLFAEMLLSELRRREPGEDLRLRRRAASWYEQQDEPRRAVDIALASGDKVLAGRLLNKYGQRFFNIGQIGLMRGWLEAFDDEGLLAYPPLAVTATWVWAMSGDASRAQQCLRFAERSTFDGPPSDGSSSFTSGVAMIRAAVAPLGIDRMTGDAQTALDLEPPGSPWHALASLLLGIAHVLNGADEAGVRSLERAAHLGRRQPSAASTALSQLSLLKAAAGDWTGAEDCADEARSLIERANLQDNMPTMLAYTARARVAVHHGRADLARRLVAVAMTYYVRPASAAFPWLAAQVALTLGRVLLDLGDVDAARLKVDEASRHLARLLTEGVLREQQRALAAELADHGSQPGLPNPMGLTEAELRVLQLLPTHLTLAEIGAKLYVSRNTIKAHAASIYHKLDTSTRAEAVQEATELGLLRN
jgi:LuxR family maltose regulon positive regulatory protein